MPTTRLPPLLDETLSTVVRRYRLPALSAICPPAPRATPATTLAAVIEALREAMSGSLVPDMALKRRFCEALAQMIRDAMRDDGDDPVFQAMALRHREALVREYASLAAHTERDRRLVMAGVNAIAHPGKQQRLPPGPQREALERLHTAASASWSDLYDTLEHLIAMPEIVAASALELDLVNLLKHPALVRLRRLETLSADERVCRYRSLWERHAQHAERTRTNAQGAGPQQRGAAVEALAMQALEALARRLNEAHATQPLYRVVSSMRVPAALPGSHERAKTEWDAVLLARAHANDETARWDICLLVEAKASADAATTDLPRLLRGLHLLAHADENTDYAFETQQGTVLLRGASLHGLKTDEAQLQKHVLYFCDAPAEKTPRLLGAASRMQLLSTPASLAFANRLAGQQSAGLHALEPVWHELVQAPQWHTVLHQYPLLRQVRELMVHADDLWAAIHKGPAHAGPVASN